MSFEVAWNRRPARMASQSRERAVDGRSNPVVRARFDRGPPADADRSLRWKGITMRKRLLALAAAAALAVSAASPAYAGPRYDYEPGDDYGPGGNPYPRTYPGPPNGTLYWSGLVDAPVGVVIPPATGLPSASGTVMPGAFSTRASAANKTPQTERRSDGDQRATIAGAAAAADASRAVLTIPSSV